jgi:hypothetical protein
MLPMPVLSAMGSKRVRGQEAAGYEIQEEIDQRPQSVPVAERQSRWQI